MLSGSLRNDFRLWREYIDWAKQWNPQVYVTFETLARRWDEAGDAPAEG